MSCYEVPLHHLNFPEFIVVDAFPNDWRSHVVKSSLSGNLRGRRKMWDDGRDETSAFTRIPDIEVMHTYAYNITGFFLKTLISAITCWSVRKEWEKLAIIRTKQSILHFDKSHYVRDVTQFLQFSFKFSPNKGISFFDNRWRTFVRRESSNEKGNLGFP